MHAKAKGNRAEYKSIRLLEKEGYQCVRAAASKGTFDVVAVGLFDILLIQVKGGKEWPRPDEMERIRQFPCPPGVKKLVHRWRDYQSIPDTREVT